MYLGCTFGLRLSLSELAQRKSKSKSEVIHCLAGVEFLHVLLYSCSSLTTTNTSWRQSVKSQIPLRRLPRDKSATFDNHI